MNIAGEQMRLGSRRNVDCNTTTGFATSFTYFAKSQELVLSQCSEILLL
jgi:hypothetical protein